MPKFIRRRIFNRNLEIARAAKKSLDRALVSRAGVDADIWPHDAAYLDAEIERLDRKLQHYLSKLNQPEYKEFH